MIWKLLEEPLHKDGEVNHEKEHMRSSEGNKGMVKKDPKMRTHTGFKNIYSMLTDNISEEQKIFSLSHHAYTIGDTVLRKRV